MPKSPKEYHLVDLLTGESFGGFASLAGARVSVIECFETDGGVNYRSDWLIFFNLCGFRLMLQATFLDGVPFDPFSFQQDSWATSEVDVGRR